MGDTPRVAVLGAGGWGSNHIRTFHELGALVMVGDPSADRQAEVVQAYPDVEVVGNPIDIWKREDVSGVVLATPAATHAELALQALEAGKDVLVEKPLALDTESGERLVAVAEEQGAVLMVGHVLEYHPAVEKLREIVTNGDLGVLRWASSSRLSLGKARAVENVVWSFATHDIALLIGLAGTEPVGVTCRGGAYITPGVQDVAFLGLSFESGFEAQVSVSWLHPTKEHRLVLIGDEAMAVFDDTAPPPQKLTVMPYRLEKPTQARPGTGSGDPIRVPVADELPLTREAQHFLDRISDRRAPLTDGRSGLRVLRVLEAANRSMIAGGTPVTLPVTSGTRTYSPPVFVHTTATVDDGASIGDGTSVWHYSHIMGGAVIGKGCSLGQNVFVASGVHIGDGVKIQNNVSVYEGVTLEDDVFCGPSMVFTNVLNPRAAVERKDEFRSTYVGRGATLGANCTIVCGVKIGAHAFVGAGSVVTRDVPDYALVTGVPARWQGWICICGEKLPEGNEPACPRCRHRYRRQGTGLNLAT